jgi:polysaccharide export outer membrane protein
MKHILLAVSLTLAPAVAVQAGQNPPQNAGKVQPNAATAKVVPPEAGETFVIGVEDVLSVHVWKETELTIPSIVVRPDGKITLFLIGDVQAAGYTTKQLSDLVQERYKEFLDSPTVTISIVSIQSQKVSICCQVANPGRIVFGKPLTVMEVIAQAGGLTEYAKRKEITIIRAKDGRVLRFNFDEVARGIRLQQNVLLEKGDTVVVR